MLTFKRGAPAAVRQARSDKPCLIIGAGRAGHSLARNLRRMPELGLRPVGFLDDRFPAHGRFRVTPVLGSIDDLAKVAAEKGVEVAIIAIPSLANAEITRIAEKARAAGLVVRYLPSFLAALERDMRASDLRSLNFDNLLGRPELSVVRKRSRRVVEGKRVLVTGAGGSIGSALCRQIHGFGAERVILLDHDESNLHRLQLELTGEGLLDSDDIIIADIRDRARMVQVFAEYQPQVVFHAAAHKHLPLLERHPCEGVKSNVVGTANVVDAAVASGAERFILISTDKAASPTSVLGATKRMAEVIMQGRAGGQTKMAAVRFGNVLGSRGSLLSVLAEQIESGRPITITAPDVTRFFMTIEEAAGLVVEAAEMADFGEIFVLDMGEPVRIVDLVKNYAAELHLDSRQVDICFTGLRPGEKLNEALFSEAERMVPTAHPRVFAALPRALANTNGTCPTADGLYDTLVTAAENNEAAEVKRLLGALLPDYDQVQPEPETFAMAAPYPDDY